MTQSAPEVLTVLPSSQGAQGAHGAHGAGGVAPRLLVVLMHGHASAPQALAPFARSLDVPAVFGFPQGPVLVGPGQHAWWPVDVPARALELATGPRDLFDRNPVGLAAARAHAAGAIAAWRAQWPGVPLVLGGFSQGGMLACELALRHAPDPAGPPGPLDARGPLDPLNQLDTLSPLNPLDALVPLVPLVPLSPLGALAGLVALSSSRVAFAHWRLPLQQQRLAGLRCLVSHGHQDAMLSFAAGEQLMLALRSGGAAVEWLPFDGGHEVPLMVWRRLRRLLRELASPAVPHVTPGA